MNFALSYFKFWNVVPTLRKNLITSNILRFLEENMFLCLPISPKFLFSREIYVLKIKFYN